MYNWGWTGKNNKTHNYFKQLYYTLRLTYSLHGLIPSGSVFRDCERKPNVIGKHP